MNLTIDLAKTMMRNDNGNLDLRHMNITSLPEGLIVPGDLDIRYTRITSLPNGLKVGGNLYIDSAQTDGPWVGRLGRRSGRRCRK